MSEEFKVIETQEQLDAVIKSRLEREAKKHSDATAGLQSEIEVLKSTNNELNERIKTYDEKYAGIDEKMSAMQKTIDNYAIDAVKSRVAHEIGLPYGFKDRLNGSTEDEIREDAKTLIGLIPQNQPIMKSTEVIPTNESEERQQLKEMIKNL